MTNIEEYANSLCRTCVYSIQCPTSTEGSTYRKCKDCLNYDKMGNSHCLCFFEAAVADICPYWRYYKDGTNS